MKEEQPARNLPSGNFAAAVSPVASTVLHTSDDAIHAG
jgi:hypothetical protein